MLLRMLAACLIGLSLQVRFSQAEPLQAGNSAVALQYHHVDVGTPSITSISPTDFRAHLQYLSSEGFSVLHLDLIVEALRNRNELPDRAIAITFDDAYLSIYTKAYPLLRQHNLPFTIFVATELVATSRRYLNWQQLAEMAEHGARIANHTKSHLHMLRLQEGENHDHWRQRISDEITGAQLELENHLGDQPMLFAYPYGEYDLGILRLVAELGYSAFGQHSGAMGTNSNFLTLPRFPMAGVYSDLKSFKTKSNALAMPIQQINIEALLAPGNFRPTLELIIIDGNWKTSKLACYGPGGKMNLEGINANTFRASPTTDVPVGRSRYNCTMPSNQPGRYFWYSQPWFRKKNDGTWYLEP